MLDRQRDSLMQIIDEIAKVVRAHGVPASLCDRPQLHIQNALVDPIIAHVYSVYKVTPDIVGGDTLQVVAQKVRQSIRVAWKLGRRPPGERAG